MRLTSSGATWAQAWGGTEGDYVTSMGTVTLGTLLQIPTDDVLTSLRSSDRSPGLTPIQRGTIAQLICTAAGIMGKAPPDLGQVKATTPAVLGPSTKRFSAVIDQTIDADFTTFPEDVIRDFYKSFDRANGGRPLPHEEATGDQIKALSEVLAGDRAPYADFAV